MSLFERAWLYITRKRGKDADYVLHSIRDGKRYSQWNIHKKGRTGSYAAGTGIGRRKLYDEPELR